MSETSITASRPWFRTAAGLAGLFTLAAVVSACDPPLQSDKNVVRAIKWTTLTPQHLDQQRSIAGILKPVDVSELSFEVPGRVKSVNVKLGDRVSKGDVLAVLETEPYELNVQSADADVRRAHADLAAKKLMYERHAKLVSSGAVSRAAYDQALAAYKLAEGNVVFAASKHDLKKRDLRKTKMRAPFSGVISKKDIEPFEDLDSGQTIFELSGEHRLKVSLRVPPTLINRVVEGKAVRIRFPSLKNLELGGTITEVGARAAEANAFPVSVTLDETSDGLHAGMSAEVAFTFRNNGATANSFAVPISAIQSGEGQEFFVFVFDKAAGAVRRSLIHVVNWRDNDVEIAGDVEPDAVIATAVPNRWRSGFEAVSADFSAG